MNLTKCKSGHYYDADKYASCPHCGKGGGNDDSTMSMGNPSMQVPPPQPAMGGGGVMGTFNQGGHFHETPPQSAMGGGGVMGGGPMAMGGGFGETDKTVSLVDAVNVASSVAPIAPGRVDDSDKTISYYGGSLGSEPVVGWLVCVEGEMLGKAFELKNGKNFIGRSPSMDIVLQGDANVSRERHAIVTYEPKGRIFFAQPGESRELFYVNGQVVLMNVELHDRDVLNVGNTKLMFVPFCGPDFSWDDLLANRGA